MVDFLGHFVAFDFIILGDIFCLYIFDCFIRVNSPILVFAWVYFTRWISLLSFDIVIVQFLNSGVCFIRGYGFESITEQGCILTHSWVRDTFSHFESRYDGSIFPAIIRLVCSSALILIISHYFAMVVKGTHILFFTWSSRFILASTTVLYLTRVRLTFFASSSSWRLGWFVVAVVRTFFSLLFFIEDFFERVSHKGSLLEC